MPGADHSNSTDKNQHEHVRTRGYKTDCDSAPLVETADPEDVFENPARPQRKEVVNALEEAGFLSSLEAEAYVRYFIEEQRPVAEQSFSLSTVESAREKIVAARQSLDVLDAYRSPRPPEECSRCGADLGDVWATNLEETALCIDCSEIYCARLDS